MATQIDIANRALLSVGARGQVSSIVPSDGSVEADALTILWQPTFEALGRTAPWNCLTKTITLTLLQAASGTPENPDGTTLPTPPAPWLYAYAYPSDCLLFRFVAPTMPFADQSSPPATTVNNAAGWWVPAQGQIPFAVTTLGDDNRSPILVVLTNQSQAQAVYNTSINNPQIWDSLFQAAMVASLGAFLVPALNLNLALMDRSVKMAEEAIKRARAMDGNEGVTSMDHVPDWIMARAGGSNYGLGYSWSNWGGYGTMIWPSSGTYGY